MRPRSPHGPKTKFGFRVSTADLEIIRRAALLNGQNESEFARDAIMTAAAECLEEVEAPSRRSGTRVLTPKGVGR